jgi:threonine dehydrogenase-like Zn-dependent dehydrogenase
MKTLLFDGSLHFSEKEMPRPASDEALIRVLMAGICNTDMEILKGYMGFQGVPGHEFVGEVVHCSLKQWIGKRVAGEINLACGACEQCTRGLERHCLERKVLGISGKDGVFAEYITLPVKNLIAIPDGIPNKEAVFIEPLAAACEILEQIHIEPVHCVAVIGDGKLAQLIVRVLRLTGCRLAAVGKHRTKLSLIQKLGIETKLWTQPCDEKFDVVVEASGSTLGLLPAMDLLKPRGILILKSTINEDVKLNTAKLVIDEITAIGSRCGRFTPAVRLLLNRLIQVDDLISAVYPFDQALEAFKKAKETDTIKVLLEMRN